MQIVDAHVHFWDPAELSYPWLEGLPSLHRAFLPRDYAAATGPIPIGRLVFVEANARPEQAGREVDFVQRLARAERRVAGIVACVDQGPGAGGSGLGGGATLESLRGSPLVKGVRHNIQGHPPGFCTQRAFIDGVRAAGRCGFTFDLCATHDQLREVTQLVRECPETRFVLDHCGKPPIREGQLDAWAADIACLAQSENVWCKLSGLLTEAAAGWRVEDLLPYAERVVECFGATRVLYGSDWPVLTLAGTYRDWYSFTERFTAHWSATERSAFYGDTAARVYGL